MLFPSKTSYVWVAVLLFLGCGEGTVNGTKTAETGSSREVPEPAKVVPEPTNGPAQDKPKNDTPTASGDVTKPVAVEPAPSWKPEDEPLRMAATPDEAAEVLDLRDFPSMGEAKFPAGRGLAHFYAALKASPKEAFDFYRNQFKEREFRELDGSRLDGASGSGTFFRDGFLVTLSIYPASGDDSAGKVNVSIQNHGNVNTYKLPVPEGGKTFYGTPIGASYVTLASVDETIADISKKLSALGWQPYGTAIGSVFFKQNAVKLMTRVIASPGQGGKTVLSYSTELLSVDIPAPAEATTVQYSDTTKHLFVETTGTIDDVAAFYRGALSKIGWKATTEKPVQIDSKKVLIFRNSAKDMLDVEMFEFQGKLRVNVSHKSAAEIAELEQLIKEESAKKKKEAESKTVEKLAIAIPDGAKDVKVSEDNNKITFTVEKGKARAALEAIRKQLTDAGWTELQATLEAILGNVSLSKGNQNINLSYLETGVMPSEVTIASFGEIELELAK